MPSNNFSRGGVKQHLAALKRIGCTDEHLAHSRKEENLMAIKKLLDRSIAESKVFCTVKLGLFSDDDAYVAAIEEEGHKLNGPAYFVMCGLPVSPEIKELRLVLIKVREMGFGSSYMPTTDEIMDWAKRNGYEPCPAEVGPALRLQFRGKQKPGKWLIIAMHQIGDAGCNLCMFNIGVALQAKWLNAAHYGPDSRLSPNAEFVFVLPDKG